MTVSDSVGEGKYIDFDTESTTSKLPAGRIVGVNSNGTVTLADGTASPVGVTATEVRAVTTAAASTVSVQTSGIAHIACAANEGFAYNDLVGGGTEGLATTIATVGTAFGEAELKAIIGRVYTPDATTTGTTVVVLLK